MIITFVCKSLSSLLEIHGNFNMTLIGINMSNVVKLAIYDKTLKFSLTESSKYNIGALVNFM